MHTFSGSFYSASESYWKLDIGMQSGPVVPRISLKIGQFRKNAFANFFSFFIIIFYLFFFLSEVFKCAKKVFLKLSQISLRSKIRFT